MMQGGGADDMIIDPSSQSKLQDSRSIAINVVHVDQQQSAVRVNKFEGGGGGGAPPLKKLISSGSPDDQSK